MKSLTCGDNVTFKKSLGHCLGRQPEQRFQLMNTLKAEYQVELLAQTLEVSPSGYYAHQHKSQGTRARQDQALAPLIQLIFQASRRTYGSPRIQVALRRQGQLPENHPTKLLVRNHTRRL
jgi:hypothetical protein